MQLRNPNPSGADTLSPRRTYRAATRFGVFFLFLIAPLASRKPPAVEKLDIGSRALQ
jgi:hypothetical protein